MKIALKYIILFLIGATIYLLIELLFRGHSHWSMFLLGGIVFIEVGALNEICRKRMSLVFQGVLGAILITASEFLAGLIINIWLGMNVWDYSNMPLNILGQVCLPYSLAWFFIAIAAVILDDYLRCKMFGEAREHYKIF